MVAPVSARDPVLYYRLDPGEPGLRTQARASESALLVTAQEVRNQTRLISQAIARGEVVIEADSQYSPGIDGRFMSVRGGLTTVRSMPREKPAPVQESSHTTEPLSAPEGRQSQPTPDPDATTSSQASRPDAAASSVEQAMRALALRRSETDMIAAASRIQVQLSLARQAEYAAEDAASRAQASETRRELESASSQLRSELARIRIQQVVESLAEVTGLLSETVTASLQTPFAIARMAREFDPAALSM